MYDTPVRMVGRLPQVFSVQCSVFSVRLAILAGYLSASPTAFLLRKVSFKRLLETIEHANALFIALAIFLVYVVLDVAL